MRPWLAIFLLVFLSLQSTWSVAAAYCQHEAGPSAFHVGHHEHKHPSDDKARDGKGQLIDGDCAECHASCAAALVSVVNFPSVAGSIADHPGSPHFLSSPPGTQPERPNWSIFA